MRYLVKAHIVNLCTRNTLFSRILDYKRLSFELVEWCSRINSETSKCENGDSMPQYLTKFTQCWDELGSVGVTVNDEDLVSLALLGLPKSWHSY